MFFDAKYKILRRLSSLVNDGLFFVILQNCRFKPSIIFVVYIIRLISAGYAKNVDRINANEADYERFEILGHDALFTCLRIDRKTLPEGLHAYDIRDSDDCDGTPSEVKKFVMVNHWGTVVTREPIEGADEGIVLEDEDYNYLGENMTLEEFANPVPSMEQTM